MSDLQRKPVTSVDASSFEFEPLLDSEEAAALLTPASTSVQGRKS